MINVFLLVTVMSFIVNLAMGILFDLHFGDVKKVENISSSMVWIVIIGFITKYLTYIFLTLTIAKILADLI